jgi:hypothetical protein
MPGSAGVPPAAPGQPERLMYTYVRLSSLTPGSPEVSG